MEKEALERRLARVCQLLTPSGHNLIDNGTLLNAMCDVVEREFQAPFQQTCHAEEPLTQSFMRNSGKMKFHVTCMSVQRLVS